MPDVDSVVMCLTCSSPQWAYRIERVRLSPIAFGWQVVKASADLPDLVTGANAVCRDCGAELRRVAP